MVAPALLTAVSIKSRRYRQAPLVVTGGALGAHCGTITLLEK